MEKLEAEGSFSVTAGGSMDPEGKADGEGVKGAKNERQGNGGGRCDPWDAALEQ